MSKFDQMFSVQFSSNLNRDCLDFYCDCNAQVMSQQSNNQKAKNSLLQQKRFCLKRSDSGLSSDSGEQISTSSESSLTSSTCSNSNSSRHEDNQSIMRLAHQEASTASTPNELLDYEYDQENIHLPKDSYNSPLGFAFKDFYGCRTVSSHDEFEPTSHSSSTPSSPIFDSPAPHLIYDYESKLIAVTQAKNILARKLIYMEEHIMDLNSDNRKLQENLRSQEALYRKKIDFREDEIDSLKDTLLQMEDTMADYKRREVEWNKKRMIYQQETDFLKQQLSTQESELSHMQKSQHRLSQLEVAYQRSTETIESLKRDRCDTISLLQEQFQDRLSTKDLEISHLNQQVTELSEQLTTLLEQLAARVQHLSIDTSCAGGVHDNGTTCTDQEQHDNDSGPSSRGPPSRGKPRLTILNKQYSIDKQATLDQQHRHQPSDSSSWSTSSNNNTATSLSVVSSSSLPLTTLSSSATSSLVEDSRFDKDTNQSATATGSSNRSMTSSITAEDEEVFNQHREDTSDLFGLNQHNNNTTNLLSTTIDEARQKLLQLKKGSLLMNIMERRNSSCDTDEDEDADVVLGPVDSPLVINGDMGLFKNAAYNRKRSSHPNGTFQSLMEELSVDSNNNSSFSPKRTPTSSPSRSNSMDYTRMLSELPNGTLSSSTNSIGELFPSLPDVMLRKLCLLRENTVNIESLSEQEIDSKFHTLSLAFKTDKFTLDQRVKLYRHQRDVAETDAKNELENLSEYIQELNRVLFSYDSKFFLKNNLLQLRELKEMLDRVEWQCQVIKSSVMKISSRSELYGAVRQEEKLSTAFDVILLHLDNLKRSKERDERELEDLKKLLSGHSDHQQHHPAIHLLTRQSSAGDALDGVPGANALNRRALKSISNSMASKINLIRVRRASVASIDIGSKEITRRSQISFVPPDSPLATTTTTTTTTFQNWPNGPATTSTTVSTSNGDVISNETTETQPDSPAPIELPSNAIFKSRRLSVPASDLARNYRPRLFQFLSDRGTKVEEEDSELHTENVSQESLSLQNKIPKINEECVQEESPKSPRRSRKLRRVTIDPKALDIDEDLLTVPELEQPDNSSNSTDIDEPPEEIDPDPNDPNPPVLVKRGPKGPEDRFVKELFQKLQPLEELEISKKISTTRQLYNKAKKRMSDFIEDFVVNSLSNRSHYLVESVTKHKYYDQARHLISGFLIMLSVLIVLWSILLPFVIK